MDMKEQTLQEKCENLMNVVVETRKQFGKMCLKYDQKTSIIENKILNLQLESLSKLSFRPQYPGLDVDGVRKEMNNFVTDIQEREKRIEDLSRTLKNIEQIVLQLKEDKINMKMKQPLTAEAKLE